MSVHPRSASVRRLIGLPLAIAALLLGPVGGAMASTIIAKTTFRDVVAQGFVTTDDGCTSASTSIFAAQDRVDYFFSSFNRCTFVSDIAVGTAVPTTFEVRGNLATVDVVATIVLRNHVSGEPTGDVVVLDNTWSALGQPLKTSSSSRQQLPGDYLSVFRFTGSSVQATATGTIPLDIASITKSSRSELTISHG